MGCRHWLLFSSGYKLITILVMDYQVNLLSVGGKGGKRSSTDADWDFVPKRAQSCSEVEVPTPVRSTSAPPLRPQSVSQSASVDFPKNQYRFIDMDELSRNLSRHLTCTKCAIKYAAKLHAGRLPTVKLVLMGDHGS